MNRKYTALRIIATMMKVLGFIVAGFTLLAVLGVCGAGLVGGATLDRIGREFGQQSGGIGLITGTIWGLIATIFPILLGGGSAMFLYAAGEAVYLQIDIEENTRTIAWYIQRQGLAPAAAALAVQQPRTSLIGAKPVSLPEASPKYFCPQCGAKLDTSTGSCPQCNYDLS